jgi:hypothetical protein
MSLLDWFKSVFGARPKRDISRLSQSGEDVAAGDETYERVDTSGKPLRNIIAGALRDRRLLPKVTSPTRQLGLTKRKTVMSKRKRPGFSQARCALGTAIYATC